MSSKTNPFKYLSPSAALAKKAGVSNSNTLLGILNPGGVAANRASDAYDKDGLSGVADAAKRGDLTDPGGWLHLTGDPQPQIPESPAATQTDTAPAANTARDRIRRLAKRAQGMESTVKVGAAAQPFVAQPKALLGS